MAGIIKGGMGYGYMPPQAEQPVMKTIYGSKPVQLSEEELKKQAAPEKSSEVIAEEPVESIEDAPVIEAEEDDGDYISEEDARIERQQLIEEYEQLRLKYEKQSEEYVMRAKEKAAEIYEKTREMAHKKIDEARDEGEIIKKKAHDEGEKAGYDEGYKKGYDEGYVNALKKCRDTLVEMKEIAEAVTAEKNEIFLNYEHALFDVIFEIARKVTLDSLKQKDKAVITKMLREAGKRFRGSKNVKITLSKLDISEEAEIDEELLKDIFKGGTNVEIEILKDAPSGTLIIDNGAEITDAGVMTQLKMIEQLGRGKYRDKSPAEMLEAQRKAKKEQAEATPDIMEEVKKKTVRRKKAEVKPEAEVSAPEETAPAEETAPEKKEDES
ncbi:MAG: hypothetical protein IJ416_02005 [Ruminiclostridium sp.]|nr:hypothetical protein [Ruminiclostridium sp.]